jgi:hypothetical protein
VLRTTGAGMTSAQLTFRKTHPRLRPCVFKTKYDMVEAASISLGWNQNLYICPTCGWVHVGRWPASAWHTPLAQPTSGSRALHSFGGITRRIHEEFRQRIHNEVVRQLAWYGRRKMKAKIAPHRTGRAVAEYTAWAEQEKARFEAGVGDTEAYRR